jgi:hypothetical protein
MAVDTLRFIHNFRIMITFDIEALGKGQDVPRAVLDAVLAPFAALFEDDYLPSGHLNGVKVQWSPPIFHIIRFPQNVPENLDFTLREELLPLPLRILAMQSEICFEVGVLYHERPPKVNPRKRVGRKRIFPGIFLMRKSGRGCFHSNA